MKRTTARNLKELNKKLEAEDRIVYAGYYAPSTAYPYPNVRQYRYENYPSYGDFEILYNSDEDYFEEE